MCAHLLTGHAPVKGDVCVSLALCRYITTRRDKPSTLHTPCLSPHPTLPLCSYISKVTLHPHTLVTSRVGDSTLFDHLSNRWVFMPGPTPLSTWLTFEVDFAFKSPLYRQVEPGMRGIFFGWSGWGGGGGGG